MKFCLQNHNILLDCECIKPKTTGAKSWLFGVCFVFNIANPLLEYEIKFT